MLVIVHIVDLNKNGFDSGTKVLLYRRNKVGSVVFLVRLRLVTERKENFG